ncbi:hypothetical protein [Saccharothrix texasensis]|uniref:hypothetical protein n=1 Tax=Saccharothrix texasensis TaxID=103734 RepID=UPI001FE876BD|nr:hypothetical protein [Saccharothrix texasensis]
MASPGDRYAFNSHFCDGKAQSGLLKPGKAADGEYAADFARIRDRAAALGTTGIVSEFGHPVAGFTSDKNPSVLKAVYQALDSRLPGARWWAGAAGSGPVPSGGQWHWDVDYGRHHEVVNDNPDKVRTEGDAMNDEHFSAVRVDDAGNHVLTVEGRVVDRLFPRAVAGRAVAFAYEDRARDGGAVLTWNRIPDAMPAVRALVGAGQFGVLVWRGNGVAAPTELHLPSSFPPASTTVVSDLAAVTGPPAHTGAEPVAVAPEPGAPGVNRPLLSTRDTGWHFALVTNAAPTGSTAAARAEPAAWAPPSVSRTPSARPAPPSAPARHPSPTGATGPCRNRFRESWWRSGRSRRHRVELVRRRPAGRSTRADQGFRSNPPPSPGNLLEYRVEGVRRCACPEQRSA